MVSISVQDSPSKTGNPQLIAKVDPSALRAHSRPQVRDNIKIIDDDDQS